MVRIELHKEYKEMQAKVAEFMKLKQDQIILEHERMRIQGLEDIQRRKEIRMKEELEYHAKVGK